MHLTIIFEKLFQFYILAAYTVACEIWSPWVQGKPWLEGHGTIKLKRLEIKRLFLLIDKPCLHGHDEKFSSA